MSEDLQGLSIKNKCRLQQGQTLFERIISRHYGNRENVLTMRSVSILEVRQKRALLFLRSKQSQKSRLLGKPEAWVRGKK